MERHAKQKTNSTGIGKIVHSNNNFPLKMPVRKSTIRKRSRTGMSNSKRDNKVDNKYQAKEIDVKAIELESSEKKKETS